MSENGAQREECLYCHNNLAIADYACPVCSAWKAQDARAKKGWEVLFMEKIYPDFVPAYP